MNTINQIISEYEQLETEVTESARIIAAYYWKLRMEKVPETLVTQLTFRFAEQLWTSNLELNAQHVYMHNDEGDSSEGEE